MLAGWEWGHVPQVLAADNGCASAAKCVYIYRLLRLGRTENDKRECTLQSIIYFQISLSIFIEDSVGCLQVWRDQSLVFCWDIQPLTSLRVACYSEWKARKTKYHIKSAFSEYLFSTYSCQRKAIWRLELSFLQLFLILHIQDYITELINK